MKIIWPFDITCPKKDDIELLKADNGGITLTLSEDWWNANEHQIYMEANKSDGVKFREADDGGITMTSVDGGNGNDDDSDDDNHQGVSSRLNFREVFTCKDYKYYLLLRAASEYLPQFEPSQHQLDRVEKFAGHEENLWRVEWGREALQCYFNHCGMPGWYSVYGFDNGLQFDIANLPLQMDFEGLNSLLVVPPSITLFTEEFQGAFIMVQHNDDSYFCSFENGYYLYITPRSKLIPGYDKYLVRSISKKLRGEHKSTDKEIVTAAQIQNLADFSVEDGNGVVDEYASNEHFGVMARLFLKETQMDNFAKIHYTAISGMKDEYLENLCK